RVAGHRGMLAVPTGLRCGDEAPWLEGRGIERGVVDLAGRLPGSDDAGRPLAEGFTAHRAGIQLPVVDAASPEALAPVGGGQQDHVAIHAGRRGAVEDVQVAFAVREGTGTTAGA